MLDAQTCILDELHELLDVTWVNKVLYVLLTFYCCIYYYFVDVTKIYSLIITNGFERQLNLIRAKTCFVFYMV